MMEARAGVAVELQHGSGLVNSLHRRAVVMVHGACARMSRYSVLPSRPAWTRETGSRHGQ